MERKKPYRRLGDLPKKEFFKAPDGYFDSLHDKIAGRIQEKEEAKVVPLISQWKYIGIAVAASIALLVVFLPSIIQKNSDPLTAEELLAEISAEDCLAYLKASELETEDILSLPEPDLWNEAMENAVEEPEIDEADDDLLFEQYGVTPDENLDIL